jgi:hypothetical protein
MTSTTAIRALKQKNGATVPLETGQVWRMADANLHVTLSGKLLVHYKLIRKDVKRTATSLSSKKVVEQFLKKNKAVLQRKRVLAGTDLTA